MMNDNLDAAAIQYEYSDVGLRVAQEKKALPRVLKALYDARAGPVPRNLEWCAVRERVWFIAVLISIACSHSVAMRVTVPIHSM